MAADPMDQRIGNNLKRVILSLGYTTVQSAYQRDCGISLDSLYKRIRGEHSIHMREIPMLADLLQVKADWLAAQLILSASDRDQFVATIADSLSISYQQAEASLDAYLNQHKSKNWKQVQRLYELGQIDFKQIR